MIMLTVMGVTLIASIIIGLIGFKPACRVVDTMREDGQLATVEQTTDVERKVDSV